MALERRAAEMYFLAFNAGMLALRVFASLFLRAILVVILGPLVWLLSKLFKDNPVPVSLGVLVVLIRFVVPLFVQVLWSVFVVWVALRVTSQPEVTWDWLYFICGFFWSSLGFLSSTQDRSNHSDQASSNSSEHGVDGQAQEDQPGAQSSNALEVWICRLTGQVVYLVVINWPNLIF